MKKLISATALALISVTANAQLNWQKGGNTTAPLGAPSTLGTNYNAPLGFLTNGTQRMFISQNIAGRASTVGVGTFFNANNLPMATMHLQSDDGNWVGGGYRTWMTPSSGTTNQNPGLLIGNADNIWLGLRNKGVWDANDAVLAWGDNGFI